MPLVTQGCPYTCPGAGSLVLSVSLSLGHWHWDDTGGVGVQPGNNRQVGVKGKPLSAPSFLSLKGSSHWRGRCQLALNTSFSRNFLWWSSVLVLWNHHVTWLRVWSGGHLRKVLLFHRWKGWNKYFCIDGNWLAQGTEPVGLSLECAILPPEAFLWLISQWRLELHRLEAKRAGTRECSSAQTRITRVNLPAVSVGRVVLQKPFVETGCPLRVVDCCATWSLWGEAGVSGQGVSSSGFCASPRQRPVVLGCLCASLWWPNGSCLFCGPKWCLKWHLVPSAWK